MNILPFDRALVRRKKIRAARNISDNDFLYNHALRSLTDRLGVIRREFPNALLIGGASDPTHDEKLKSAAHIKHLNCIDIADIRGRIHAIIGDEEFLPFAPESFDLILSNLSLQDANDFPGALIQIRRSLKPDGAFLGAFLGGETLKELRECLMLAEISVKGGVSPRVSPFADRQQAGALMQRAQFTLPVVDSEKVIVTYKDIYALMRDLRGMGLGNTLTQRSRAYSGRRFFQEAGNIYRQKYTDVKGLLEATFEMIFVIGWAPHESQPKPLARGSATHRLADILK